MTALVLTVAVLRMRFPANYVDRLLARRVSELRQTLLKGRK